MSVHSLRHSSSPKREVDHGLEPEELWDLHGLSLFAMSCALLGDHTAAMRAVTLGMVDLYRSSEVGGPPAEQALRSAARHVFRHCDQMHREESVLWSLTEPSVMTWLGELADFQRHTLALCVFGGHTYREAADVLGVPPGTVARLLISGLHQLSFRSSESGSSPGGHLRAVD